MKKSINSFKKTVFYSKVVFFFNKIKVFFNKIKIWGLKNFWFLLFSILFFIFYVFNINAYYPDSDKEFLTSAVLFSTGRLSHILNVNLFGLLFPIDIGTYYYKFLIINAFIYSIFLFNFAKFIYTFTFDVPSSLISQIGMGFSLPAVFSILYAGNIPLTLLLIIIILRFPLPDLYDFKTIFITAFLLGLGFVSLHPVFRFLLPPFVLVWLLSLRHNPKVFFLSLFFFVSGMGVILFIPISLNRNPYFWANVKDMYSLLPILKQNFVFGFPHTSMSTSFFVWGKDLLRLILFIFDNIPILLIPLSISVLFINMKNKILLRKLLIFAGLSIAEILYYAWMKPYEAGKSEWGIFIFMFLWFASSISISYFIKISKKISGFVFIATMFVIVVVPSYFIFKTNKIFISKVSAGELFIDSVLVRKSLKTDFSSYKNVINYQLITALNSNFINPIVSLKNQYSVFPEILNKRTKKQAKTQSNQSQKCFIAGMGNLNSDNFYIQGSSIYCSENLRNQQKTNYLELLKYYILISDISDALKYHSSLFLYRWGETFFVHSLIKEASQFTHFSLELYSENILSKILLAKILTLQGRLFESEFLLDKISKKYGYIYTLHLLKCINLFSEIKCGFIPKNQHNTTLLASLKECRKAMFLSSDSFEPYFLVSEIYKELEQFSESEFYLQKSNQKLGINNKTKEKYRKILLLNRFKQYLSSICGEELKRKE